jgi:hypothetical protein
MGKMIDLLTFSSFIADIGGGWVFFFPDAQDSMMPCIK